MSKLIIVKKKITPFNKQISVSGDKSLSIRWVLFSSIATGKSKAYNLLLSEDVLAAINAVKKLGVKVKLNNKFCTIKGNGLAGYKYKKNLIIDAKNSGTLGRLIMGLLIDTKHKIKIIGVGGVDSGKSAYEKFLAGASYVQLYTGMVFQGPNIVVKIKKELKELLIQDGVKNFKEIIGKKTN